MRARRPHSIEKRMPIINAIASVAVRDLNAAIKWYEALFRKAPTKPMPEVAEWSFERGGWLQVYQLPERADRSQCDSFSMMSPCVLLQAAIACAR